MVKSFINAFFGGIGRTLGKIVVYIIIALIFFFIYENANAAAIYGPSGCTSTHYRVIKNDENGTDTYGITSTNYNIPWAVISFYGTENMTANTYYDITITFINNLPTNFVRGVEFYQTSSLCGAQSGESSVSSYTASGKTLTFRVLTGLNLVDYWQTWITLSGATSNNGISTVTLSKVDLSGSSGIIENNNNNTNTIVNNNNQNTQDIIDNQNQNTQDIIDNQNELMKSCFKNILNTSSPLIDEYSGYRYPITLQQGVLYTISSTTNFKYKISTYRDGYADNQSSVLGKKFTFTYTPNSNNGNSQRYLMVYTSSFPAINISSMNMVLTKGDYNGSFIPYNQEVCSSKFDDITSSVTGLTDTINDDSEMDTNIFSTWWSNFNPGSNPLGNVITLPITLAQKIVGFNENSCQNVNLGALLGTTLILPCFTLSGVLPDNASTLINTIDVIMSISLLVVLIKNTYETIANLISLGGENEVKKQFRLPTPLEFLSGLFNGGGN